MHQHIKESLKKKFNSEELISLSNYVYSQYDGDISMDTAVKAAAELLNQVELRKIAIEVSSIRKLLKEQQTNENKL